MSEKSDSPAISSKNIWVIIPGFNEANYISKVLKKTLVITPRVIFVDDGSSDNTASIAKKQIKYVLSHQVNLGKGAAMKTGAEYAFKHLGAEAVIFMDADDQHRPEEIRSFVSELKKGNQVVFGVRVFSEKEMPLVRFLGNKLASAVITVLFHRYIPDILSGYKALTKRAYQKIRWRSLGYEVEMEIAVNVAKTKLPYTTVEIETIYHDVEKGVNILDAIQVVLQIIKWRFGI